MPFTPVRFASAPSASVAERIAERQPLSAPYQIFSAPRRDGPTQESSRSTGLAYCRNYQRLYDLGAVPIRDDSFGTRVAQRLPQFSHRVSFTPHQSQGLIGLAPILQVQRRRFLSAGAACCVSGSVWVDVRQKVK